jgi:hypothetical protein
MEAPRETVKLKILVVRMDLHFGVCSEAWRWPDISHIYKVINLSKAKETTLWNRPVSNPKYSTPPDQITFRKTYFNELTHIRQIK